MNENSGDSLKTFLDRYDQRAPSSPSNELLSIKARISDDSRSGRSFWLFRWKPLMIPAGAVAMIVATALWFHSSGRMSSDISDEQLAGFLDESGQYFDDSEDVVGSSYLELQQAV